MTLTRFLVLVALAALCLGSTEQPAVVASDLVSPVIPITTRDGEPFQGIHLSYHPFDGSFVVYGKVPSGRPVAARLVIPPPDQPWPTSIVLTEQPLPVDIPFALRTANGNYLFDTPECGITAPLYTGTRDEEILASGGGRALVGATGALIGGLPYALRYAVTPQRWTRDPFPVNPAPPINGVGTRGRWYGSATRVWRNGASLIVALNGFALIALSNDFTFLANVPNLAVETYQPTTGWTIVSPHEAGHFETMASDYTFVQPQPDGTLWAIGDVGEAWRFSLDTGAWTRQQATRGDVGQRAVFASSAARVPYRLGGSLHDGSVVITGGQAVTDSEHSLDVIDPTDDVVARHLDLGVRRMFGQTLALLDGSVGIFGGVSSDGTPGQDRAVYVDVEHGAQRVGASTLGVTRAYHGVTGMDRYGQVVYVGGRPDVIRRPNQEQNSLNIIRPAYIGATQPTLFSVIDGEGAPLTAVRGGQTYRIVWQGDAAATIAVALIAPTMSTHGYESNARWIEQPVRQTVAMGPYAVSEFEVSGDVNRVPPGTYMITVLVGGVPAAALPLMVLP